VNAADLIRRKRDGERLTDAEIQALIAQYARGDVPDYQMSAMAMAIVFRGLDTDELAAWTRAMLDSGDRLSWDFGPIVDKHSTGGVGDKTSLVLAPVCAALGLHVPMISGRGLGHTGGTLDKLESIPGYDVSLSAATLRRLVRDRGMVICGQTGDIVPADKRLYALRDVTGTVESIPLIASSIMSKKLAEGLDGLVLDVKVGSGAFMRTVEQARQLGRTMVSLGEAMEVPTRVVLSSMDQPLGVAVGNALEVREAALTLQGQGPADLVELVEALAAEMLVLGGVAHSVADGEELARTALNDGSAWACWLDAVAAQGGNRRALEDLSQLPTAPQTHTVVADTDGVVAAFDTREVGLSAVMLGAGRARIGDAIDPAVGLEVRARLGDRIRVGEPLFTVHYTDARDLEAASNRLTQAVSIRESADAGRLILDRI
jgi:pyrimidine-nucleoside phosphorylase